MVHIPRHLGSIHFYVKTNKSESKFSFTCEKIQNQCSPNLLMTCYFEFKWLFINVKLAI